MIVNKLQSFLAENPELAQAVEPRDQATVDGGTVTLPDPPWGPSGGCIPKKPIIVDGPSQPQPLPHGQW
jgi:hypothetical protein